MEEFLRHEAIRQVSDADALHDAFKTLILDPSAREALGQRAADVVDRNRGVIERTVARLEGK
jgi:3-deoxy-D-manno-octulosonic-acid transferase